MAVSGTVYRLAIVTQLLFANSYSVFFRPKSFTIPSVDIQYLAKIDSSKIFFLLRTLGGLLQINNVTNT